MSNHETVDHAEWLLMEQIIRSLCVDPALLRHMTAHGKCEGLHSVLRLKMQSSKIIHIFS